MDAEQLYAALDRAGLTPPVHFAAAPREWREAMFELEADLEAEVWALNAEIDRLQDEIRSLTTEST